MRVTTNVTFDGPPQHRPISLKRMAKGGFRGLRYVLAVLFVAVAFWSAIFGPVQEPNYSPAPVIE